MPRGRWARILVNVTHLHARHVQFHVAEAANLLQVGRCGRVCPVAREDGIEAGVVVLEPLAVRHACRVERGGGVGGAVDP